MLAGPGLTRNSGRLVAQAAMAALLLGAVGIMAQSLPEGCSPPGFFHGVASGDPLPDRGVIWTRFTPQDENSTTATFPVEWLVATDANMTNVTASGNTSTSSQRDFTVKVDVGGLQPDTRYFYYFRSGNYASPLGMTRTAPAPGSPRRQLRFAISSCASWRFGYFHAFNLTAQVRDLDFLLFLGDWIYEYGNEQYPSPPVDQVVRGGLVPAEHDTFTLQDYRARHRLHRTDLESQEMSRRVPIIVTWDDHDLADNAWKNGSLDQDRADKAGVSYQQRMQNAVQAFYEYLPLRDPSGQHPSTANTTANTTAAAAPAASLSDQLSSMYRSFTWGDLATLVVTDQRFQYRTEPVDQLNTPYVKALQQHDPNSLSQEVPNLDQLRADYYRNLSSPQHELIGDRQLSDLARDFNRSVQAGVTWQLYADQVIMGERRTPDVEQAIRDMYSGLAESATLRLLDVAANRVADVVSAFSSARVLVSAGTRHDTLLTDGWDGYTYERDQLLDLFQQLGAEGGNPVSLAGDSHNAWAYELPGTDGQPPVAAEFCTASVTPPGLERGLGFVPGIDLDEVMVRGMYISNPSLKYAQIKNRGIVVLTATAAALHADYFFVDSIGKQQEYDTFCDRAFDVRAGQPGRLNNGTCTPTDQLLYRLYSEDDPLQGRAFFQTARADLDIAANCPANITCADAGGAASSGQGIVQQVGSAISNVGSAISGFFV